MTGYVAESKMEIQKKKKGLNHRKRSPVALTDRDRRGVKFVPIDDSEGEKQRLAKGRKSSVSPVARTSTQKDSRQIPDKAHSLHPASAEASKGIDTSKPSKKTQYQTDPARTAKLAPVAKTMGLLKSPVKVTTAAKSDVGQGSRRTSLTSTKKPKIKMKRSKTEEDNAEDDRLEERGRKDKRSVNIRLPEIIIDVPKDNIEDAGNVSAAMLVQNLQTVNIIPDKQVGFDQP